LGSSPYRLGSGLGVERISLMAHLNGFEKDTVLRKSVAKDRSTASPDRSVEMSQGRPTRGHCVEALIISIGRFQKDGFEINDFLYP